MDLLYKDLSQSSGGLVINVRNWGLPLYRHMLPLGKRMTVGQAAPLVEGDS